MLNAPSSSRALVRRVLGYRLYNEAVHTGDGVVNGQLCAETSREVHSDDTQPHKHSYLHEARIDDVNYALDSDGRLSNVSGYHHLPGSQSATMLSGNTAELSVTAL